MKKQSLQIQLLLPLISLFIIGVSLLFYMSYTSLQKKVDLSQEDIYNKKIDNILFLIKQKHHTLEKTKMVKAYEDIFKKGTIKVLKEVFLKNSKNNFPFLIDENNSIIFVKDKNSKDFILEDTSTNFLNIKKNEEGSFLDEKSKRWYIYKSFKAWNWSIVYSVDEKSKYDELSLFRNEFLLASFLIILIMLISTILIVKYFTSPILKLNNFTKEIAEGRLDTNINIKAGKELSELANNFKIMRDNIFNNIKVLEKNKKEITNLNKGLELKVEDRTMQLQHSNEELEDSNEELQTTIHNLKQTQDQLIASEKMASLGGLVAGVAHEINTPIGISLTGITHLLDISEVVEKNYLNDEISKEEFEEYLETSKILAKQINMNLVKTAHLVKSFKQISVDQTSEIKRKFNIKSYFEDTIFSLNNMLKKNKIEVNIHLNEDIVITSYPGEYSQIITNLIQNTIKHAYSKNTKNNNQIIDIKISKVKNTLEIVFQDYGVGISQENLKKIFNPFFTTNRENGGTGLGLNIIYNIITSKLNGEIKCRSKLNEGTSFIIKIPL